MLEPSGPLPASVYWRRRTIAVGGAVGALVMMVWALGAMIGSAQPGPGTRNTADERALSVGAARSSAAQESSAFAGSRSVPFDSAAPGASPASGVRESGSPESGSPVSGSPQSGAPSDHGKPLPACNHDELRLDARVSQPDYAAHESPRFQLALTNTGVRNCYVDVSRDKRALGVYRAGKHVWSSSDCYFGHAGEEIHRLAPNQAIAYDITWARRTSAPGCTTERGDVSPGRYALLGRIGRLVGAPTLFVLRDDER